MLEYRTKTVNEVPGSKLQVIRRVFCGNRGLCLCFQAAGALPRPHSLLHVQHGESFTLSLQKTAKVTLLLLSLGISICLCAFVVGRILFFCCLCVFEVVDFQAATLGFGCIFTNNLH